MSDDPNVWLSISEIARQRGVSKVAVHKRVKAFVAQGALATRPGPRNTVLVNVVAYDRLVKSETDPAQALRNAAAEPDAPQQAPSPGFAAHRAARESYQAENARLDLEERLGRLVDRDAVARTTMDVFRRFRDRMLSIPPRAADRLAALPDAAAIRAKLAEEIRRELEQFAARLDAMNAGAVGEDTDWPDDAGDLAGGQQPAAPA